MGHAGRVVVALVMLVVAPWAGAQPAEARELLTRSAVAELYLRHVDDARQRRDDSVGAQALRVMAGVAGSEDTTVGTVCAFLTGTGQNPKWDGGGSLVQLGGGEVDLYAALIVHDDWEALALRVAPDAVLTRPLVIVDAFELDALLTALYLSGGATAGAIDDALWDALFEAPMAAAGHTKRTEGAVPHGNLVLYHLIRAIEPRASLGVDGFVRHAEHHAELRLTRGGAVHLLAIRFDHVDTIERAFQALLATPFDAAERPVVVMSWGLVDCAVSGAYRRASAATPAADAANDYVEYLVSLVAGADAGSVALLLAEMCDVATGAFAELTGVSVADVDCGRPEAFIELAPLVVVPALAYTDVTARSRVGFDAIAPEAHATFVAAAGNQGLVFPMPPAAWETVVGVAACQPSAAAGLTTRLSPFSNAPGFTGQGADAAVTAVGAFFAWPHGVQTAEGVLGYYGTSFAAPTAALAVALLPVPGAATGGGIGSGLGPCAPYGSHP